MAERTADTELIGRIKTLADNLIQSRGRLEVKVQQAIAFNSRLRDALGPIPARVNNIVGELNEVVEQRQGEAITAEEMEERLAQTTRNLKQLERTARERGMNAGGQNPIAELVNKGRREAEQVHQAAQERAKEETRGRAR